MGRDQPELLIQVVRRIPGRGQQRLAGNAARQASSAEVKEMGKELDQIKLKDPGRMVLPGSFIHSQTWLILNGSVSFILVRSEKFP